MPEEVGEDDVVELTPEVEGLGVLLEPREIRELRAGSLHHSRAEIDADALPGVDGGQQPPVPHPTSRTDWPDGMVSRQNRRSSWW